MEYPISSFQMFLMKNGYNKFSIRQCLIISYIYEHWDVEVTSIELSKLLDMNYKRLRDRCLRHLEVSQIVESVGTTRRPYFYPKNGGLITVYKNYKVWTLTPLFKDALTTHLIQDLFDGC